MKNTQKSAFPLPKGRDIIDSKNGLSKLEYFAGQSMAAIISNDELLVRIAKKLDFPDPSPNHLELGLTVGRLAIYHAKCLLEELEKEVTNVA